MSAFLPSAGSRPPTRTFEGVLSISGSVSTRTVRLLEGYLSGDQLKQARDLPAFNARLVQDGNVLLPVERGYTMTGHPYWDIVLEPGQVWNEVGDEGWTRAALPFALVQKNMNCTHYGVLSFLFNDKGRTSRAFMQISSETCTYLHLDMWGIVEADHVPQDISEKDAVIDQYREIQAHSMQQRPIKRLADDYPGVDPSSLALEKKQPGSLYGLVVDGIHYVSDCPTRRGDYPFCDVLPFPSYSTAKSLAAGVAFMAMAQLDEKTPDRAASLLLSAAECHAPKWRGVTLRHLLDMTTGLYDDDGYMVDESAEKIGRFFAASTARDKMKFACGAWPRKADPGQQWVYHTPDTFLLSAALNEYLRRLLDNDQADIFRDLVDRQIYSPLRLSATARSSRRTADAAAEAFFGYGLQFHRDDVARLGIFLSQDHGRLKGKQVLKRELLDQALQHDDGQRGSTIEEYPHIRYTLGFWARDIAPLLADCDGSVWVPFMSGYGGISVVLYDNGITYYHVTDSDSAAAYDWGPSAPLVHQISDGLCR